MNLSCLDHPARVTPPFSPEWLSVFEHTLAPVHSAGAGEAVAIGATFDVSGFVPEFSDHPTEVMVATDAGFQGADLGTFGPGGITPLHTLSMQIFANPAKVKAAVMAAIQPEAGYLNPTATCTVWFFGRWALAVAPNWSHAGLIMDDAMTGHEYLAALGAAATILEPKAKSS